MANGAVGGKLAGAGGGGFLLFLAEDPAALRAAMEAEGLAEVRFGFDHDGSTHRRSCLSTPSRTPSSSSPAAWERGCEGVAAGFPKALVPVLGEPFAFHQLRLLASRRGPRGRLRASATVATQVRAAVGDGSAFGVAVTYVDEGEELHGTGGALRLALDAGALAGRFRRPLRRLVSADRARPGLGGVRRGRPPGAHDRASERGSLGSEQRRGRGRARDVLYDKRAASTRLPHGVDRLRAVGPRDATSSRASRAARWSISPTSIASSARAASSRATRCPSGSTRSAHPKGWPSSSGIWPGADVGVAYAGRP